MHNYSASPTSSCDELYHGGYKQLFHCKRWPACDYASYRRHNVVRHEERIHRHQHQYLFSRRSSTTPYSNVPSIVRRNRRVTSESHFMVNVQASADFINAQNNNTHDDDGNMHIDDDVANSVSIRSDIKSTSSKNAYIELTENRLHRCKECGYVSTHKFNVTRHQRAHHVYLFEQNAPSNHSAPHTNIPSYAPETTKTPRRRNSSESNSSTESLEELESSVVCFLAHLLTLRRQNETKTTD